MLAAVPEHGVLAAGASALRRIEASLAKSEAAAERIGPGHGPGPPGAVKRPQRFP